MRFLILFFLIIGSGLVSSHRQKRNLIQFSNMIRCVTGRSSSYYNGYGCWCGYGGRGKPVDATDRCCKAHDTCYDWLVRTGVCSELDTYIEVYSYSKTCGSNPSVTCDPGNSCEVGLCNCDRDAVNCFGQSSYNPMYRDWDNC